MDRWEVTRGQFLRTIPASLAGAPMLSGGSPAENPPARKRDLLFFFADEKAPATGAVVPVLSWLADQAGMDFEAYICIRPKTWAGRILAFNGNGHREQFYYLANFYRQVHYCSLTESPALQFKREVLAFGGAVVSARKPAELVEFYRDLFAWAKAKLPEEALILPARPEQSKLWLQPFCYPDVNFRRALAVTDDLPAAAWQRLREAGVKKAVSLYCSDSAVELARQAKLTVSAADAVKSDDNYASITCRIADRWLPRAKGIAFADPVCTLKWQPYYLREKLLTLYEPSRWKEFAKTVGRYAAKTGNTLIVGNQMVEKMSDSVITEFSREGVVMSLAGVDARVGTTLQTRKSLPLDWLRDFPAPWEQECTDGSLADRAARQGIAVCFLFYAADLGHLPAMHRVLDLMLVEGLQCGFAFPSTWYDFQPQMLEQLYIPMDLGGVFPNIEPMLVSAGVGVATEAEGYLDPRVLSSSLRAARASIARHVGERHVPIGYYSFQDACPDYKHNTGKPPYDLFEKSGVEYAFSYKQEGQAPAILHESGKFTVMNQQGIHWFANNPKVSPLERLKEWEARLSGTGAPAWITFGFDIPFYGLCPRYFRGMESLVEVMSYVIAGGAQKKLFIARPHETVRYARMLKREGRAG
jgi:hypothetical protein